MSVGVDIFDQLYLENGQFTCPWCKLVLQNENMRNEDKWEISTNRNMRFFYEWSKYIFWFNPTYEKDRKIEECQTVNFDESSKYIYFIDPFLLNEYHLFSQNTESSLEQ